MLPSALRGRRVQGVERRAKYLLIRVDGGALIIHLGMSGSLRVVTSSTVAVAKHDHLDLVFDNSVVLRFNDPRRFGSVHWQPEPVLEHWLLAGLGPEPLGSEFDGQYLKARARGRRLALKNFLMDSRTVVGVGNIYANEALFLAGLRPTVGASRVTRQGYERLAQAVRYVLSEAITMGGTTLRDFVNSEGNPGYFKQWLNVYGREGEPCRVCGTLLKGLRTGQRATVYCSSCQAPRNLNGRDVDVALLRPARQDGA